LKNGERMTRKGLRIQKSQLQAAKVVQKTGDFVMVSYDSI